MDNMDVDSVTYHPLHDEIWNPLYGERSVYVTIISATMYLSKKGWFGLPTEYGGTGHTMKVLLSVTFFRNIPKAIFHKVTADLTEYAFPFILCGLD